ncbi:hypothetical protein OFEAOIEE_LOCUS1953 [Methylorubrum extorquens]
MLNQERRRAVIEHVESGAGARINLQQPPAFPVHEAIGAGKTGEAGGASEPKRRLGDLRGDRGRDRHRLVAAAGERAGIAERPQRRGRLPLLGQRQGFDAAAIGQKVQGEGAAGHPGLEVAARRGRTGRARADMRTAAAPCPLEEPGAPFGDRAGADRRMRDREAFAQGGKTERILEGGDRLGASTEQAMAGGDLRDEVRRPLEAAAEHHAGGAAGFLRQRIEPCQHAGPVAGTRTEAAGQRAVALGQRQGVLVAEQIEHERAKARPPRGLRQRPAGLGGDQDRVALPMRKRFQVRAQPAISTASL